MSYVSGNNPFRGRGGGAIRWSELWADVATMVRAAGSKGVLALVFAAAVAFIPLGALIWFNVFRLQPVNAALMSPHVRIKAIRPQAESERDEADDKTGKTGLLQIVCDVPAGSSSGTQPLLTFEDSLRQATGFTSVFTRNEVVYLRPKVSSTLLPVPYGLLGPPPVSVWLPAGEYELLVVYQSPRNSPREIEPRPLAYPLVTASAECKVENRQRTVQHVLLPHYDYSFGPALKMPREESRGPTATELTRLADSIEHGISLSTPGGTMLLLSEPAIHHSEDHEHCTVDFQSSETIAREWTNEQLFELWKWLPADQVAARQKLAQMREALGWRQFFAGWFCYAAAGISGLVFTRFGAIFLLDPGKSRAEFARAVSTLVKIFLFSMFLWFVFSVLTSGNGCHGGAVPFRLG